MKKEEENIIKRAIDNQPLKLLTLARDLESISYIDSYLPFSIGIEFESPQNENFDIGRFTSIPNIMAVDCDSAEQRLRIPSGILGMICLWHITEALAINCDLNPLSGIHYHVDMTENYHLLNDRNVLDNKDWMLKELDKWKYPGAYNRRDIKFNCNHNWMRFQYEFKTAEIRIGEMSFDYSILIKRIIHLCSIIKQLSNNIGGRIKYKRPIIINNPIGLISYQYVKGLVVNENLINLQNKLKKLKTEQDIIEEDIEAIMNRRIIM